MRTKYKTQKMLKPYLVAWQPLLPRSERDWAASKPKRRVPLSAACPGPWAPQRAHPRVRACTQRPYYITNCNGTMYSGVHLQDAGVRAVRDQCRTELQATPSTRPMRLRIQDLSSE
jgi:hypothetical protein